MRADPYELLHAVPQLGYPVVDQLARRRLGTAAATVERGCAALVFALRRAASAGDCFVDRPARRGESNPRTASVRRRADV